ncbi:MAG: hypothetical protein ACM3ST_02370, partial [Bdellovibrio bacteriovorus]
MKIPALPRASGLGRFPRRGPAGIAATLLGLALAGCQSLHAPAQRPLGAELDAAIQTLASPQVGERARARAAADYRRLAEAHLPDLLRDASERPLAPLGEGSAGIRSPRDFSDIQPVTRPRLTRPELHRAGLGLPLIGHLAPDGPNAPRAGYRLPLTLVALPEGPTDACCEAAVADPRQVDRVRTDRGDLPLAMDLETPLTATRVTGPRLGAGIANLLRPGHFVGRPRIVFLQPFDPDKTPVVLVHGLMSTPRMWEPLVL